MDFHSLSYLKSGNARQRAAFDVLTGFSVFEKLADYTPFLAGTVPIAVDVAGSDLDILCCFEKQQVFTADLKLKFGTLPGFLVRTTMVRSVTAVIGNFMLEGFPVEVFGQKRAVTEQEGYRHMMTEQHLLEIHGEPLRKAVVDLKRKGEKTEPAFAKALKLKGDPYEILLNVPLS